MSLYSKWLSGAMPKTFKRGDHVEWNSEAGRVSGAVITKKVVSDVRFKGYHHHATKEEPQYFIKSDKTDHIAINKGAALRLLKARPKGAGKTIGEDAESETLGARSGFYWSFITRRVDQFCVRRLMFLNCSQLGSC